MMPARCARSLLVSILLALSLGCGGREAAERHADDAPAFDPDLVPDGYRLSTAALAWPFATRAFQITPAGDLYNGDWRISFRPAADGAPADSPRVIAFEDRWRPVAHWRRRSAEVRWDFEALALPAPADHLERPALYGPATPDTNLYASVEVEAANLGSTPRDVALEVALEPRGAGAVWLAPDAPSERTRPPAWAGAPGADTAFGWAEGRWDRAGAPAPSAGPEAATIRRAIHLAPGGSARFRFVLPAHPAPAGRLSEWARVAHRDRADEARKLWDGLTARGARFELGDPEVESALRAALVVLLSCRERRGTNAIPIGNPFQYRDVWLRDGARQVAALAVAGYTREARELAAGLTFLQWPSGAFLSQAGQLDGTGQALWALGQAYLRPPPVPSVEALAAPVMAGWRWCERQRRLGRAEGRGFPGLLPPGDPHDNENVFAQLVGNDAWAIAGYHWAAMMLLAGGLAPPADSIERSLAEYLNDFHAALAHTGAPDVPPSWQGIGLDWGNLAVGWPCGVLPPRDPRCLALARRVWSRSGDIGMVSYRTPDSLSYYVGADLGTWALLAGEREAADRVLDGLLRFRTASGGAGELFHRGTRDYGDNLPPHATGAAALVCLVRNALVFDDGPRLELTLGARARWWRGGRVRGAPTRWGVLDLEFSSTSDSASWRWSPVQAWTALHLPPGTVLGAPPDPPLRSEAQGTVVLAPPGMSSVRVSIGRPRAAE